MDVINSLLRAARAGNLKRVIDLIEDELVDINSSNQNGLTALHAASKEGQTHVVEELLSRGANVHTKTHKGNTALHIASLAGHESVVRLLIEMGADVDAQSVSGFTALYMAAQENHESIVRLLLSNKANQNVATTDGFTPLAVAMQQGHEQIASILLDNEAKGRIRFPGTTESGRSLLHIAAKKDDCAAAALLMQNNIGPDVTSKSGFTALHVASHYGNKNIAQLLIDRQADVNFKAKHDITPIHVAAKWGKDELVDLLLANGANIEATTRDGLTPLHCAARSGHDGVVEDLIRRGAPISAKTRSGLAPLHMATQGDHHGSTQLLLNYGAPVDDVTVDYLTALHVASHCGHVKVAKLLLENKADPNFRALNGFTSLHIACKKNRLKVVELLLKYGASLNAVTESGLTPLHVASFMGCTNIVVFLLENNANIESVTVRGETPLHLATRANQIDVINVLLSYGANVNVRAKESQTALHIAARLGNAEIARLLLEQGVDADSSTKDSYTALHIASKEGHEEVVSLLLNHGANIACATRNHGFTPLHLASKYGIEGVVDLLLSYGAPVDAQGKNGVTPLHVATHYDHPNVVELLLQAHGPNKLGASPHAMAKNGYTALHIAAKGNRLAIADVLLQHGANPNAESKAGFSPLHLAAQEGRPEIAGLLLNCGAHVNCRAKNGITPLHLCAQEDHIDVAQLLVRRGAHLDEQTRGGFTPLHVASHFARIKMIMFLLANGANVNIPAGSGYTPLHQASQQGNPEIVGLLLQYNAKPDALTEGGQTALSIAQNLGYVSIIDTLKVVTETVVKTTTMTITEEKFKIVAPETMQETFVSDSEDEADDTAHAESVKFLTTDVMKNFNSTTEADYATSQSNLAAAAASASTGNQERAPSALGRALAHDEMSQDLKYLSREAPLDGGESTFGGAQSYSQLAGSQRGEDSLFGGSGAGADLAANVDNVDTKKPAQQSGFLVSFMVDARGGAMRGFRHSGVRVIIPPDSAQMPTRITCRYLRRERLVHPPPLMEGEACASKIMEVGPAGAKFLGPVLIEVPHFASLRGDQREIIILRSDSGEVWREHNTETDERLVESIVRWAEPADEAGASGTTTDQENSDPRRLTRIVTTEFPQYFAIISRIKQHVHAVGPTGATIGSQTLPGIQAHFPQGALKKRIKIGLQTTPTPPPSPVDQTPASTTNLLSTSPHCNSQPLKSVRHATPTTPDILVNALTAHHHQQQQQQQNNESSSQQRPGSPDHLDERNSPANGERPNSRASKRRSRLLACFGSAEGEDELNNESMDCLEKPVERRFIIGDISDSDSVCGPHSSPSPTSSLSLAHNNKLVPEDYYIEPEPALILNQEPKTYGKRLASSAAQTEAKSGKVATGKRAGLLKGRRKNKTQLNIICNGTKKRNGIDSSASPVETQESEDSSSIEDVVTSADQKWRTCTIQTDSDSIIVNYVISGATTAEPSNMNSIASGPDDGYVSGGAAELSLSDRKKSKSAKKSGHSDKKKELTDTKEVDRPMTSSPSAKELKVKEKIEKQQAKAAEKQRLKEEKKAKKQPKKLPTPSGPPQTPEEDTLPTRSKVVAQEQVAEETEPTPAAPLKSAATVTFAEGGEEEPVAEGKVEDVQETAGQVPLRPILKHQSSSEQRQVEAVANQLVEEATEEAVRSIVSSMQELPTESITDLSKVTDTETAKLSDKSKKAKIKKEKKKKVDKKAEKKALEAKKKADVEAEKTVAKLKEKEKSKKKELVPEIVSEVRDSSTSRATSGGFLSRMFGSGRRAIKDKPVKKLENEPASDEKKDVPEISSEMYPSDPDDANGEMILEVNIPKDLIEKSHVESEETTVTQTTNEIEQSDIPQTPTQATTIDETLVSQVVDSTSPASHPEADEDQATLVNVSQLVTAGSNDLVVSDDEATDNAVSQLQESEPANADASHVEKSKKGLSKKEKKRLEEERAQEKKKAKEEEKRRVKEEKKRLKELETQKKAEKRNKKGSLKEKEAPGETVSHVQVETSSKVLSETTESAPGEQKAEALEAAPVEAEVSEKKEFEAEGELVDTEVEVEKIVEEVVGDDGVVTRTTKLIETKYVTTRQEEVQSSEHREMPEAEFDDLLRREEQHLDEDEGEMVDETLVKKAEVPPVLAEIISKPSCFGVDCPGVSEKLSAKDQQKKRVKLNQKLIKKALKFAKGEAKRAKESQKAAESEIRVAAQAARDASKCLEKAKKLERKAAKEAEKKHKKMNKIDKKLAKTQCKIEKKQRKLDKKIEKLNKKESKRLAKNRKSIKIEDIGKPQLQSSSSALTASPAPTEEQQNVSLPVSTVGRHEEAGDEPQVEMTLEDHQLLEEAVEECGEEEPNLELEANEVQDALTEEKEEGPKIPEQVEEEEEEQIDVVGMEEPAANELPPINK